MFKDPRVWSAAIGFAVAAWLIVPHFVGERRPDVSAERLPEIEYVCRESREVFRMPPTGSLLPNPKTGRATLVPAVYDRRTKTWRPGPPLEVRQREPVRRPVH